MNTEALNLKESVYGEREDWRKERKRILKLCYNIKDFKTLKINACNLCSVFNLFSNVFSI